MIAVLSALLLASSVVAAPDLTPVAGERSVAEPPIALVSGGKAQLPIVFEGGARERQAALYLATTIRDITGVRPPVYETTLARPVTNSPAMRLSRCSSGESFRVMCARGSVYFLGRSDFAVRDWCERILGVRTYCVPTQLLGRGMPHCRELTVPAVDYTDLPVFGHRDDWPFGRERWSVAAKVGGAHRGGVNVHAPHRWFADPEVRTNHPAIFALKPDGSRGEMPLLCYGNPETLEYYKRRIDEHIAGIADSGGIVDTNRHVITVSQWDCRLECECEHCRRLFDPSAGTSGSGSPIIWGYFLKELAQWAHQAHPGYLIAFLPYLNTCDVPPGLDLRDEGNCEAMLCTMPGLAMLKELSVRRREERLIVEWAAVTGRPVVNWHYGCWPRDQTSAPYLFGHVIAGHYRRMAPFTVGSFINGGADGASERLMLYVWLRCLWNPGLDVEAVYDEYARRMFGVAAPPMRRLMDLQERGWAREWPEKVISRRYVFDVSYPAEVTDEMRRLLAEAERLAADDPAALRCVRWYAADFARFFADEQRYRSGMEFEPLMIPFGPPEASPCRWLVNAFEPGRQLRRRTSVRASADELAVTFAIHCEEPEMAKLNRSAAHGELRTQDTVELYLAAATGTTYRVMTDVRGRISVTAGDREWTAPGVTCVVTESADAWTVTITIPYGALPSWEGLRGNVVRWHPGPEDEREWSRLSTLGSKWNQDRDAFTRFLLEQ